jgi:hypothetical protein
MDFSLTSGALGLGDSYVPEYHPDVGAAVGRVADFVAPMRQSIQATMAFSEPLPMQGSVPYADTNIGRMFPRDTPPPDPRAAVSEREAPMRASVEGELGTLDIQPGLLLSQYYLNPEMVAADAAKSWESKTGWVGASLRNLVDNPGHVVLGVDSAKLSRPSRSYYAEEFAMDPEAYASANSNRFIRAPLSSGGALDRLPVLEEIRHSYNTVRFGAMTDVARERIQTRVGSALGGRSLGDTELGYRGSHLLEAMAGISTIKQNFAKENQGEPLSRRAAAARLHQLTTMPPDQYRELPLPMDLRRELEYLRKLEPGEGGQEPMRRLYDSFYDDVVGVPRTRERNA